MKIARESYSNCPDEAFALGLDHWRELYGRDDFAPDTGAVRDAENNERFGYFTVRDEDGKLCGHAGFMIFYMPIFRSTVAMDSFYYIAPEHRGGGLMSQLLAYAAQTLTDSGATQVFVSHHVIQDLSKPIGKAGFALQSNLYLFGGH